MTVSILYICTGKYSIFWKNFFESFEKYFLPNTRKEYVVFTDAENLIYSNNERVHIVYRARQGWPGDTLFRFEMFANARELWINSDYTLFINANFLCIKPIIEEEFLPLKENLLVAHHAGPYGRNPDNMDYERNPKSLAYIPYGEGKYYVMGGLNGGKTEAYDEMISVLKANIQKDYECGIIAKNHDESHLNKYILDRNDYKILPPSFGYPEGWKLPYKPDMLILDKSRFFDVAAFKVNGIGAKIKLYLGRLKSKISIRNRMKSLYLKHKRGE